MSTTTPRWGFTKPVDGDPLLAAPIAVDLDAIDKFGIPVVTALPTPTTALSGTYYRYTVDGCIYYCDGTTFTRIGVAGTADDGGLNPLDKTPMGTPSIDNWPAKTVISRTDIRIARDPWGYRLDVLDGDNLYGWTQVAFVAPPEGPTVTQVQWYVDDSNLTAWDGRSLKPTPSTSVFSTQTTGPYFAIGGTDASGYMLGFDSRTITPDRANHTFSAVVTYDNGEVRGTTAKCWVQNNWYDLHTYLATDTSSAAVTIDLPQGVFGAWNSGVGETTAHTNTLTLRAGKYGPVDVMGRLVLSGSNVAMVSDVPGLGFRSHGGINATAGDNYTFDGWRVSAAQWEQTTYKWWRDHNRGFLADGARSSNLSGPATAGVVTVDSSPSLTPTTGFRLLLRGQTTPSENGIWTYSGDGTNWTQSTDANTAWDTVYVQRGGTQGGNTYIKDPNSAYTQFYFGTNGIQIQGPSRTVGSTVTDTSTPNTITVSSGTPFTSADVGNYISGTGIPRNTKITAFGSSTSVTVDKAVTASGTITSTVTHYIANTFVRNCVFEDVTEDVYWAANVDNYHFENSRISRAGDWALGLRSGIAHSDGMQISGGTNGYLKNIDCGANARIQTDFGDILNLNLDTVYIHDHTTQVFLLDVVANSGTTITINYNGPTYVWGAHLQNYRGNGGSGTMTATGLSNLFYVNANASGVANIDSDVIPPSYQGQQRRLQIADRNWTSSVQVSAGGNFPVQKQGTAANGTVSIQLIAVNDNTCTLTAPAGCTLIGDSGSTFAFGRLFAYAQTYFSGMASAPFNYKPSVTCIMSSQEHNAFGLDTSTYVDQITFAGSTSSTTVTAPSATIAGPGRLVLRHAAAFGVDAAAAWPEPPHMHSTAVSGRILYATRGIGAFDATNGQWVVQDDVVSDSGNYWLRAYTGLPTYIRTGGTSHAAPPSATSDWTQLTGTTALTAGVASVTAYQPYNKHTPSSGTTGTLSMGVPSGAAGAIACTIVLKPRWPKPTSSRNYHPGVRASSIPVTPRVALPERTVQAALDNLSANKVNLLDQTANAATFTTKTIGDPHFSRLENFLNGSLIATGRPYAQRYYFRAGEAIHSITWMSASTAAGTPLNQWAFVGDLTGPVLAKTGDLTTTAWGTFTRQTFTFATDYVVGTTGDLYIGVNVVATTVPSLFIKTGHAAFLGVSTSWTPVVAAQAAESSITTPASCPSSLTWTTSSTAFGLVYVEKA